MAAKTNQVNYKDLAKQAPTSSKPPEEAGKTVVDPADSGIVTRNESEEIQAPVSPAPTTSSPLPANTMGSELRQRPGTFNEDREGNVVLGDPKVYDSVGEAGSGFTNLSHLLALNKGSGFQSAKDLAKRTTAAGNSAMSGITGAESSFGDAARAGAGIGSNEEPFDLGASDAQQRIDQRKGFKYTGPNDLTSMGGYADLAKKVGSAEDMAKSVTGGANGLAGQVNKETGLSPTQSAASAFYMGVNNPNLKRAGNQFTNLSNALEAANARAANTSSMARGWATQHAGEAEGWQQQKNDWDKSAANTVARANAVASQKANDAEVQGRQDVLNQNGQKEHRTPEIMAESDANWANKQGMPYDIINLGVSYDDWVAMGKPSWNQYQKDHPK